MPIIELVNGIKAILYASVTFATAVIQFSLHFFGIIGCYKLRRMWFYIAYDHLAISLGDKLGKTLQRPCGHRRTNARLSCSHCVIFTTSLYKSHNAHTMTLRKSQGVGTLTVQLSCKYVHGLNGHPCSFLDAHLNCASKSCDYKSCYEEASVVVVFC